MASRPRTTCEERDVPVAALGIAGSRYAFLRGAERDRDVLDRLAESMRDLGQISPVLAHEARPGTLHVVDGFARVSAARQLGWESLACTVLAVDTPVEQLFELLVTVRRDALADSAVARARLLGMGRHAGIGDERLCTWLLPALGLQPHARVLARCMSIAELPETVADFCADKGFSLKQCVHIARHSRELLDEVFSWRDRINLTASLAEELLDDLTDYLRAHDLAPGQLAARADVRAVLDSGDNPQQAARRLRDLVRSLRAPVLTSTNQRMDALASSLALPGRVRLDWDRSLERRELGVRIALRDPEEWPETLERLTRAEFEQAISSLLEEL